MRYRTTFIVLLLLIFVSFSESVAADSSPWALPEDAIARIGKGQITDIAYSPDGKLLAVGNYIGTWLYDAHTGEELALLTAHTDEDFEDFSGYLVWDATLSFSPDGKRLAAACWDGKVRVWDVQTRKHITTLRGFWRSALFSPDGKFLVTGDTLWDADTFERKNFLNKRSTGSRAYAFSPDGTTLVTKISSETLAIALWNLKTEQRKIIPLGADGSLRAVAYSPDGTTFACGGMWNHTVQVWDTKTEKQKAVLTGHTRLVNSVVYSPDGTTLATACWNMIRLWDAKTGQHKLTITKPKTFTEIEYTPDGKTLTSVSTDGKIQLWDAKTGQHKGILTHLQAIYSMLPSPDGKKIVTGGRRNLLLWNISTLQPDPLFTGHTEDIAPLLFSRDGATVTCLRRSMEDVALLLCNIHTGKHEITFTQPVENVYSRRLSPDGKTLALRIDSNTIQLWDTGTSKRKATLTKPEGVSGMVFSPDSSLFVTGDDAGTIEVWDTVSGQHKSVLTNQERRALTLVFSPDGEVLASTSWREARLWNIETGTQILPTLRAFGESRNEFVSLAFSPDRTVLASGGYDGKIRLWNIQTGDLKDTLIGHTGPIESLVFLSPEQPSGTAQAENEVLSRPKTTLASLSGDGTVLLWKIKHFVDTKAAVNITPPSVESPEIGEQLTLNIDIAGGKNVRGYQLTLEFDATALRYVSSENGSYLPSSPTLDAAIGPLWMRAPNRLKLVGACPPSESNDGDGTLARVTFEVIKAEASNVRLSRERIEKSDGSFARPKVTHATVLNPLHAQNMPTDYTQFALPEGAKARLGKGPIYDIKFSPDNTQLAVASSIGIWMHDANTGAELALITEHTRSVSAIAFSSKGDLLTGSTGGTIHLWNSRNYQHLKTFKGDSPTLAFSPDGTTLFNGRQLWNIHTGQHFATIKPGNAETVTDAAFSPDGTTLATITRENKIELWDGNSGQLKTLLHDGSSNSYRYRGKGVFSLDGTRIAAIGSESNRPNNSIFLWDTHTGELLKTFSEKNTSLPFLSLDFSAQDELITVSREWYGTLHLQNFHTNEKLAVLDGHTEQVYLAVFSPDKTTLASVTEDGAMHLWDLETTKVRTTLTGYGHAVNPIVVSDEDKTLALGNHDEHTRLWPLLSPQFSRTIRDMSGRFTASAIAFSPNSATLVGKASRDVFLWDTNTYKQKFTFKEDPDEVVAAAFSPDGRTLVVATMYGNLIHLWNMDTGQHKLTLKGHAEQINAITFSPDGTTIATAEMLSEDEHAIRLWDAKTGIHHTTFANLINPKRGRRLPIMSVAFSPDGKTLASIDAGGDIQLWNMDTGKHKTTLANHSVETHEYYGEYSALTFSPDSTTLVSSGDDFIINIWNVETGKHQGILKGHTGAVATLAYSADGTTLISGSRDATALVWQMDSTPIPRLNISPLSVEAPPTGKQLTFSINMTDGQNVTGYKFTVQYNAEALRYIPNIADNPEIADVKIKPPVVAENAVTLAGSASPGTIINDGTIATVTFEIIKRAGAILTLTDASFTHNTGKDSRPLGGHAWIVEVPRIPEDANRDWQVNAADLEFVASQLGQTGKGNSADINGDGIVDLADLVLVANALYPSEPERHTD